MTLEVTQRAATLADLDETETGRLLEECPDAVDLGLLQGEDIEEITQKKFKRRRLMAIRNYVSRGNALDDNTTMLSVTQHLGAANGAAPAQNGNTASAWVWRDAHPFCQTSGSSWAFQNEESIAIKVRNDLPDHFKHWLGNNEDKGNHPLFLCLSGAGTGKSRLLDELPRIAQKVAIDEEQVSELAVKNADADQKEEVEKTHQRAKMLRERLDRCFVFKVSFENGTAAGVFDSATEAIGTRMMFQMAPDGTSWDRFRTNQFCISAAIETLAGIRGCKENELTVFLLVDGLQQEKSILTQVLKTVADWANGTSGAFFICCCAATIVSPVKEILKPSAQNRVYLTPGPLDGGQIVTIQNKLVSILVSDMGGHGRALEALAEALVTVKDLSAYGFSRLANDIRTTIQKKYPFLIDDDTAKYFKPLLVAALLQTEFARSETIPGTGGWTVDQVLSNGLFSYDEVGKFLKMPYILIWTISGAVDDPILSSLQFANYDEHFRLIDASASSAPLGAQCWQHWEEFNVRFRCLKNKLLENTWVPITKLHAGARFDKTTVAKPPSVLVKKLDFVQASRRTDSASDSRLDWTIEHEMGSVNVSDNSHVALNAAGAPYGDAFVGVDLSYDHSGKIHYERIHEVQQYKLVRDDVTQTLFEAERDKSIAQNKDFFIVFTATSSEMNSDVLPLRSGIIDKTCFDSYYGPFAGRAFFCGQNYRPGLNSAPRCEIEAVAGVGQVTAGKILAHRPYSSVEDCAQKTKLSEKILSRFSLNG